MARVGVIVVLAILAVSLVACLHYAEAQSPPTWVGVVNDVCTGTVVRSDLVVTASHCVGAVGSQVTFRSASVTRAGLVLWDSALLPKDTDIRRVGLDLAILYLRQNWPYTPLSIRCVVEPPPLATAWTASWGQEYWPSRLRLARVVLDPDLGELAAWVPHDPIGPGSSGALVLTDRGCLAGVITHGLGRDIAGMVFGAPGWRIWEVLSVWLR